MNELDTKNQLTSAKKMTHGMMLLIPNTGFYKPRYDLHTYFLQQEKDLGAYEYHTLARYYENGLGVAQNKEKAALFYKQAIIRYLPNQRGAACRQEIDHNLRKNDISSLQQEQISWLKNFCTAQPSNIYNQANMYLDKNHNEYAPLLAEKLGFYLEVVCDYRPARDLYSRALKARISDINH